MMIIKRGRTTIYRVLYPSWRKATVYPITTPTGQIRWAVTTDSYETGLSCRDVDTEEKAHSIAKSSMLP